MKPIAIQMALANVGDSVDAAAVYAFIEAETDGIETYIPAPPPPGMSRKAAVDFALVLTDAAQISTLAYVLWQAYDRFIAPRKSPKDDAGIYLVIPTDHGALMELWIGNQYRDRDLFVKEFTVKVESIETAGMMGKRRITLWPK
jgi:hypothetical protein